MNLVDLLTELKQRNIYLYLENGDLRGKAPPHAMTPELKIGLQTHKLKLIEYLRQIDTDENDVLRTYPRDSNLPLSYSQERLWFLDQFEPGGTFYNMPGVVRLVGELDVEVLERSINEIIRRHEVLRTTFNAVDGKAEQVIASSLHVEIKGVDLRDLTDGRRESEIRRYLEEDIQQPFDLLLGPLVRATLLFLRESSPPEEAEHILLFTLHHIVSDGWSTAILIREFIALYEAYRAGRASPLPELTVQYADYAIWQRKWLQGERLEQQVNYWKQHLAGAPAILELPTDYPRPVVQSYRGATLYTTIPLSVTEQLKQLGRQQDATLFMVLLAAFNILLSRYSGQDDLCVGTPIANRNRLEIEGLIGFFINTLVLRTDLSGNPTFIALLKRVKEVCLGAQAHQDLPFEKLVEELSPVRDMSHNPLFQVMLALQNTPETTLEIEGLKIIPEVMEVGTSKFDLDLEITESGRGLEIQYSYNTDLFDRPTIERFAEHFGLLLESITIDPNQLISELPLLTTVERNQLLIEWSGNEVAYPAGQCIHQLFEEQVTKHPDAVALVFEDKQLSYEALNQKANRLAHFLRSQGIGPEVLVGICIERSLEMMVGILGILKAGGAYLPIEPELPEGKLRLILQDAGVEWVLTSSTLTGKIPERYHTLYLDQEISAEYSTETPANIALNPQQLAYMLYTSGTTGIPKGVGVTHGNLINQYYAWQEAYELGVSDVHLQMARYTFDVFAGDWIRALCSGGKLVICPRETLLQPDRLYAVMQSEPITVAEFVPAVLRALVDYLHDTQCRLDFMRLLICGSDRWYMEEYKQFSKLCAQTTRLVNSYGLTETTIDSTYFESPPVKVLTQELVPIGQQFANTRSYVLDRWLNPVPIGVAGELYIGGAGVARGYFNRPELTAERFVPSPFSHQPGERLYKTGDVVRYLLDGNIEHLGRSDHQVKIRGLRIELGEIEAALLQHPDIRQAVVVAREERIPDAQRLVAYVVGNEAQLGITELHSYLKAYLVDYMIPSIIVLLDEMPLNANGKIDRKALPEPTIDGRMIDQYVAPRNEIEEKIAIIWAEVLGIDQIGIHDNFFQLGGHSLLAMTVIERMRRQGLHAEVRSLFICQTLQEFAAGLNKNRVVDIPDNLIPPCCERITPEMLPLITLKQSEVDSIIQHVPGGARNVQDIYPLTPFQEGILFHHLITRDGDPYVLSSLMAFEDRYQVDCFLSAVQAVINRHDILRTAILWEELSVPVQVVLREVVLPITEVTFDPILGDPAEQLRKKFDSEHFRIDIRQAPLMQGYLTWDEYKNRWILLILEHHLALDHVAMETVLKEVSIHLLNRSEQLPLPLPFRNFVAQTRFGIKSEEHEAFFTQLLGNVDEPTAPFGLLNIQGDGSEVVEAKVDLEANLNQRIRACAKLIGVSAASIFHLAWAQVLSLISAKETVVFGTVLFGRTQNVADADRMLGMFINTLPVRFDVNAITVTTGVRKMHQLLADLMRHEHASLSLAQRCSAVPPPAPLFSALLNYRHSTAAVNDVSETTASLWKSMGIEVLNEDERTNYPLTLSIDDYGTAFGLTMQVQSPIEPQRIMRYMQTALTGLVDALTANPQKAVCTINVLPESEQEQLLVEWNRIKTDCLQDQCIHELFEQQVRKNSNAIAVVFEDRQLTYSELNAHANQIAHSLRAKGICSEVLVGLFLPRSVEMIIGILGVLKAGGAYLPIDPSYPQERIAFMIDDAKPQVIVTQSEFMELLPDAPEKLSLDHNLAAETDYFDSNPISTAAANNLAYVIYTSGSTGRPKGVMVTHHNVRRLFAITEQEYHFNNEDVWTLFHSYAFDFSVWEIWGALLYGGRLIVVPDRIKHSPEAFHQLLQQQGVTVLNQTPTSFYQLDHVDKYALMQIPLALRLIIFGGEALELGKLQKWFERHGDIKPQLVNMYGITETTVHVTRAPLSQVDAENSGCSTIGHPISDLQAFILDQQHNPVPVGVAGELYIGGAGLARGYLNRADLTADRFIPHPFSSRDGQRLYRTGDLACYRDGGDIEYLGRIDQQVKIRGFRIELGEIENLLSQHPWVRESAVVARENAEGEKRLIAYIASDEAGELDTRIDSLRTYLQKCLPDYMVPAAFVFLDTLPLTANGKVNHKALPEPDICNQMANQYVAPRNPIEQILCQIWEKVLRLERIGIDDNFFTLGGDSIRGIQVVGLAKEQGITLPMDQLYRCGTIRSLGQNLTQDTLDSAPVTSLSPYALIPAEDKSNLPGDIEDAYPLTAMQAGMIFHSQQELGAYHVIDNIKLKCALDPGCLQAALEQIFSRHAILRTTFDLGGFSKPLQLVHRQGVISLITEDLRGLPPSQQEQILKTHIRKLNQDYFDVTKLPLIKFSVYYLEDSELQFSIAAHHAILDGWSLVSLLIEIFQQHFAVQHNKVIAVSPLPNAMRDLVIREQNALQSKSDQEFWSRWLDGATLSSFPHLIQVSNAVKPMAQNWPEVELRLTAELSQKLKQFAQSQSIPLKSVLLAVHLRILSLLYGETKITTGLVTSVRPEELGSDQVLGVFLNTLPLVIQLSGGTWGALIHQVFRMEQRMLKARYYPLANLQKLHGGNRIFDTTFNYLHYHNGKDYVNSDQVKIIEWNNPIQPNFALEVTFSLEVETDVIELTLQGDQARLDQAHLQRISEYYISALTEIAEEPVNRYDEKSLLSQSELQQLLIRWNQTTADYPDRQCIHDLIETQVDQTPDFTAVSYENQQLTYDQLNKKANQLAHYLKDRGVGPEVLVGLCVERSLEMIVSILAILKAGGAYLPIDPDYPAERIAFMVADAYPTVILVHSATRDILPGNQKLVDMSAEANAIAQFGDENPTHRIHPHNLAYVIYTSGSTGKPKGSALAHQGVVNRLAWMQKQYALDYSDKVLQKTPFSFDVSVWEFFWPLMVGARLIMLAPGAHKDSDRLIEAINQAQITTLHFVPSMLAAFLESDQASSCQSLRQVFCSGEALPVAVQYKFLEIIPAKLHNLYGPTEASVDVTFWACKLKCGNASVPIGHPIDNIQIYLLDAGLHPVPVGVAGELYIGGIGLARGYLNRAALTAERFIPNPFAETGERLYRTGDLARYRDDGAIEYIGRTDYQVKIRGFRIELGEIETALLQYANIHNAAVIVREDTLGDKRLIAYVAAKNARNLECNDLKVYLKEHLPDYMIPSAFVVMDHLPISANGKLDRNALPAPDISAQFAHQFVAPRTQNEKIIASLWAEALGLEQVGINDNFFELGGHSLLSLSLIERIRRQGFDTDASALFSTRTLAEFVATLRKGRTVTVAVPGNAISEQCEKITPEMLPLVSLNQSEINNIVERIPGGIRNIQDIYSLTPFQEGILFHHMMSRSGDPYLLSSLLSFETHEKLDDFIDALQIVINRHDVLRTAIVWEELSTPVQVVLRQVALTVTEIELDPILGNITKQLHERFNPRTFKFELCKAPLLSAHVAYDPEQHCWLLLILVHHLILDHEAVEALLKEVQIHLMGRSSELKQAIPFRNYVARTRMGIKLEAHELFFRKMLEHVSEPTAPFGLMDVQGDGVDIAEATLDVDEKLAKKIYTTARSLSVSAASIFHLAWAQLLAQTTGNREVVFGTLLFGRMQGFDEGGQMLGVFINTLPIHFKVDAMRVQDSVRKMHKLLAELLDHEYVSLATAQRCSGVPAPTPLFSALLNYRHTPKAIQTIAKEDAWSGIKLLASEERSNYPISLSIDDFGDSFQMTTQVQSSIDPQRINSYLYNILERLLEAIDNSNTAMCTLSILPKKERQKQLIEWNNTKKDYPSEQCIHHLFEEQAAKNPHAVAAVFAAQQMTYGELNHKANQLAHFLIGEGVKPDMLVGIYIERSLEMIVAILGILKAGGAYLPIDPHYPEDRIHYMVNDAKLKVILTLSDSHQLIPDRVKVIDLLDKKHVISKQCEGDLRRSSVAQNLAYMIYTSGSTGKPKGVRISHRNVVHSTSARFCFYEKPVGCFLLLPSFAFDSSVAGIFWTLTQGGCLCLLHEEKLRDPLSLVKEVEEKQVTHLLTLPSFYQLILEQKREKLLSLRTVIVAGESCPSTLVNKHFEVLPAADLYNEYGPTEGTVWSTACRLELDDANDVVSIGYPIANAEVYLLDEFLNLVPWGVKGEIYIGGEGIAQGYLNHPDQTAERFIPNPFREDGSCLYKTGDLACYRIDGQLNFLGRVDNQVKIRGFRIELGEIEFRLMQLDEIREAVVLAKEFKPGDLRLFAYCVPQSIINKVYPNEENVRAKLQKLLPEYMIPSILIFLDAMPQTPNGKIDRNVLLSRSVSQFITNNYQPPKSFTEQALVEIWSELLGIDQIGVYDNFFELGGHSILTVKAILKINAQFNLNLPVNVIFMRPTIAQLAEIIEGRETFLLEQESSDVNLHAEAQLDLSIQPNGDLVSDYLLPREILLTGATGFLGAFLLVELLQQTTAHVHCLIRAESIGEAFDKLRKVLNGYGIDHSSLMNRISLVCGDLSKPSLGLSPWQFNKLADQIEAIYHNGAQVNFTQPYAALKAANVIGTQEVLRLACAGKTKPVHYVSTLSIFGTREPSYLGGFVEDDFPDSTVEMGDGYSQSKWVAEKLIRTAANRGLPITIHRPATVGGHSITGAWNTDDFLCRLIRGCIEIGKAPAIQDHFDIVPVDYVSKAIVYLSRQPQAMGKAFHFSNRCPIMSDDLIDWINTLGYRVERVPYADWLENVTQTVKESSEHPLYSLLPILQKKVIDDHVSGTVLKEYNTDYTEQVLAASGIDYPRTDWHLIDVYLSYLQRSGSIKQSSQDNFSH